MRLGFLACALTRLCSMHVLRTRADYTVGLKVGGTIPVSIFGVVYNIPIAFVMDKRHPYIAPKVHRRPAGNQPTTPVLPCSPLVPLPFPLLFVQLYLCITCRLNAEHGTRYACSVRARCALQPVSSHDERRTAQPAPAHNVSPSCLRL